MYQVQCLWVLNKWQQNVHKVIKNKNIFVFTYQEKNNFCSRKRVKFLVESNWHNIIDSPIFSDVQQSYTDNYISILTLSKKHFQDKLDIGPIGNKGIQTSTSLLDMVRESFHYKNVKCTQWAPSSVSPRAFMVIYRIMYTYSVYVPSN